MQVESVRLTALVQEIIDLSRLQVRRRAAPAASRSTSTTWSPRPSTAAGSPRERKHIELVVGGDHGGRGLRRPRTCWSPPCATWSTTRSPTRRSDTRVAVAVRRAGGLVEVAVTDQGVGIAADGPGADLRALLPGRPGPLARHRRHRPGPEHRQARRRQPRRRGDALERPGQGSTFTLRLPDSAQRSAAPRHRPRPPAPRSDRHRGRRRATRPEGGTRVTRILVVEDEESFSDPLSYLLRKEGYEVEVADDGPDGPRGVRPQRRRPRAARPACCPACPAPRSAASCGQRSTCPVIMLTAKDSEIDKVVGPRARRRRLRHQAVLLARARGPGPGRAAPRGRAGGPRRRPPSRPARCGWTSNGTWSASTASTCRMPLKEFELLEMLLRNAGRVLTRDAADRPGLGLATTWATPRPSTSTSSGCAARSSRTRRARATWSPCGGWATSSRPDPVSWRSARGQLAAPVALLAGDGDCWPAPDGFAEGLSEPLGVTVDGCGSPSRWAGIPRSNRSRAAPGSERVRPTGAVRGHRDQRTAGGAPTRCRTGRPGPPGWPRRTAGRGAARRRRGDPQHEPARGHLTPSTRACCCPSDVVVTTASCTGLLSVGSMAPDDLSGAALRVARPRAKLRSLSRVLVGAADAALRPSPARRGSPSARAGRGAAGQRQGAAGDGDGRARPPAGPDPKTHHAATASRLGPPAARAMRSVPELCWRSAAYRP